MKCVNSYQDTSLNQMSQSTKLYSNGGESKNAYAQQCLCYCQNNISVITVSVKTGPLIKLMLEK